MGESRGLTSRGGTDRSLGKSNRNKYFQESSWVGSFLSVEARYSNPHPWAELCRLWIEPKSLSKHTARCQKTNEKPAR